MGQAVILIHVTGMMREYKVWLHLLGKSFNVLHYIQQGYRVEAIVRQGSKVNIGLVQPDNLCCLRFATPGQWAFAKQQDMAFRTESGKPG